MTYQFKVGDTGKTRDGRAYRVLATDLKNAETIVVAIENERGEEYVTKRFANGKVFAGGTSASGDLIPPTPAVYINVYVCEDGRRYSYNYPVSSREQADMSASRGHTRIGCIRVPLEARFDD